ncbi:MAG TPA: hypothetical protein VJ249_08745 [Candidatus Bathyarchaeia archaeon]|nr:hypothetical protein [Candidatus Bathyarchaeia archaeon]
MKFKIIFPLGTDQDENTISSAYDKIAKRREDYEAADAFIEG